MKRRDRKAPEFEIGSTVSDSRRLLVKAGHQYVRAHLRPIYDECPSPLWLPAEIFLQNLADRDDDEPMASILGFDDQGRSILIVGSEFAVNAIRQANVDEILGKLSNTRKNREYLQKQGGQ